VTAGRQLNQPSSQRVSESEDNAAYYAEQALQPNFPHWDPEQRAMGAMVSADEMFKAGVAIDGAASEWTPTRSDAAKQREYADEAVKKELMADVDAEMKEIAQGKPLEGAVA
jgi:hypothetical protein